MSPDDDLAKFLPEAPPRPDRRDAAIAEAMRRFDGETPAPTRRRIGWIRPAWTNIGRVQLGVLVSMAAVAVIGVPVALQIAREQASETSLRERLSKVEPASSSQSAPGSPIETAHPSGAVTHPAPAPTIEATRPQVRLPDGHVESSQPETAFATSTKTAEYDQSFLAQSSTSQIEAQLNRLPQFQVSGSTVPPTPDRRVALADASAQKAGTLDATAPQLVITGSRIMRKDLDSSTPVVTVDQTFLQQSSRGDLEEQAAPAIVLTGSRTTRAAADAARRGDWNACTVDDPDRNLARCKSEVDPGAKGDKGRSAARIADGLTKAWSGDTSGAISAFDNAIQINPKRALAYLNRGMAYQRSGESERAIEDFDQAVRYAPNDARAYYHRSLALKALGKDKSAKDDASRAVDLDPQYANLFD